MKSQPPFKYFSRESYVVSALVGSQSNLEYSLKQPPRMFNYDIPVATHLLAQHSTLTTTITMTITTVKMMTTVVINISMTADACRRLNRTTAGVQSDVIYNNCSEMSPTVSTCLDDDKCDIIDNKVRHG